jgi:two-component system cell cycle response regulator DivK
MVVSDRRRVLYVEDDYHNFLLVQRTLSVLPEVEVRNAASADEGLEMARAEKPDLILVDVLLPGMDGLEMTRRLKADEDIAHIPVVALTANVMKGERQRAQDAGCVDFVAKPFSLGPFRQLVAKYLGIDDNF